MPIAEFWAQFDRKLILSVVETKMRKTLIDVVQGDRTVVEYEEDFTHLSNFVLDKNNERKKKLKFMNGLAWRIRQHLIDNPALETYSDVFNAALHHFQDQRFCLKGKKEWENLVRQLE